MEKKTRKDGWKNVMIICQLITIAILIARDILQRGF
jgi:hypothetical protein